MTQEEQIEFLKQQLEKQEKLAEIGQLTAGILHEIRNPLNFVTNFSNLSLELTKEMDEIISEAKSCDKDTLSELSETSELLKTNILKIKSHGERASRLIANMLASTHEGGHKLAKTEIAVVTEEAVKLAYHGLRGNNIGFNAELIFEVEKELPNVNIVYSDFSRTILNIAGNAFFALAEKQEKNPDFKPTLSVNISKVENEIVIKLRDNGTGMSQETIDKIFKPFFTTKSAQLGTGLGLSMSHQIITQIHQGKIEVASELGKFSEFIITFPASLKG